MRSPLCAWSLIGVLLIGFALTDGFDMGVGALLPFVARRVARMSLLLDAIGIVPMKDCFWTSVREAGDPYGQIQVAISVKISPSKVGNRPHRRRLPEELQRTCAERHRRRRRRGRRVLVDLDCVWAQGAEVSQGGQSEIRVSVTIEIPPGDSPYGQSARVAERM